MTTDIKNRSVSQYRAVDQHDMYRPVTDDHRLGTAKKQPDLTLFLHLV